MGIKETVESEVLRITAQRYESIARKRANEIAKKYAVEILKSKEFEIAIKNGVRKALFDYAKSGDDIFEMMTFKYSSDIIHKILNRAFRK